MLAPYLAHFGTAFLFVRGPARRPYGWILDLIIRTDPPTSTARDDFGAGGGGERGPVRSDLTSQGDLKFKTDNSDSS